MDLGDIMLISQSVPAENSRHSRHAWKEQWIKIKRRILTIKELKGWDVEEYVELKASEIHEIQGPRARMQIEAPAQSVSFSFCPNFILLNWGPRSYELNTPAHVHSKCSPCELFHPIFQGCSHWRCCPPSGGHTWSRGRHGLGGGLSWGSRSRRKGIMSIV